MTHTLSAELRKLADSWSMSAAISHPQQITALRRAADALDEAITYRSESSADRIIALSKERDDLRRALAEAAIGREQETDYWKERVQRAEARVARLEEALHSVLSEEGVREALSCYSMGVVLMNLATSGDET